MEKTNSISCNNNGTIQNSHNNSVTNNGGVNGSNTMEKSSNQSDQLSGGWERVSEELSDSQEFVAHCWTERWSELYRCSRSVVNECIEVYKYARISEVKQD
ncbi:unnamed protein product [Cercopithifilaria johnstoni]|uniref:Uncharacterized protein n=1 Tax=Cercopithifilaria johnstoni TaxID=2874296 RepID=A0A8J2M232_9BILA|nr:unnamed protein product [Cercopithifilaria johnstoni]